MTNDTYNIGNQSNSDPNSLIFPLICLLIFPPCVAGINLADDTYSIGNQSFFASGDNGGSGGSGSSGYNQRVCRVYDIEQTKYRKPQWYVLYFQKDDDYPIIAL